MSSKLHAEAYFYCFSEPRENRIYITDIWHVDISKPDYSPGAIRASYQKYMSNNYGIAPYDSDCLSENKVQNPRNSAQQRRKWKIEQAQARGKSVSGVSFAHDGTNN